MCNPKNDIPSVKPENHATKKCTGKCKECREKKAREHSPLIKTLALLTLMLITTLSVSAQDAAKEPGFWSDPFNSPMLPLYLITTLIFVMILLIAFVGFYLVKVVNLLTVEAEKERARQLGIVYKPRPTWWSKFVKQVNDAVPIEEEASVELDHNYDGIKELDNHLPPWWTWLFVGTVVWGAIYLFVYHISDNLPLQQQEYQNEVAQAEEAALKLQASQPQAAIDENTLVFEKDAAILTNGQNIFTINCVACHAKDGGGNAIGPNLVDEYWLHGGSIKNIFTTVKNGVVEKGMPAWGKNMSPKDVRDVAFYVMSLQGTKPANPKAPQGDLYKPEPAAADTTNVQASL
ncbi:MAG: c-type cytochrome [Cyclobacteriaceae bacterium]|nr:c-type cytochrome [Cyclobacteriaceae bacterium]